MNIRGYVLGKEIILNARVFDGGYTLFPWCM